MASLNAAEQEHFGKIMEQKQMKEFMTMYSDIVQRCFTDCANDFTSKALSSKEEECVGRCADKFMKFTERAGLRFQEANQAMAGSKPTF